MSRRLDIPDFRKGQRLSAEDLNKVANAVRVSLRASGIGLMADQGGLALRAFRAAASVAPLWARVVSYQLQPFTGTGGIPPAWKYAWQSLAAEPNGGVAEIVDGSLSSTVASDPYGLHAINDLEKWDGSGAALRYGVGVLLTQASGATLVPQPIAVGRAVQLTPLLPGYPGGYRFSTPNGYDVTCPTPPPVAGARAPAKVDDTLGALLKGVLGW